MTISYEDVLMVVAELDYSGAEAAGRAMDDPDELDYLHQSYELRRDWPWKVAMVYALLAGYTTQDDHEKYLSAQDYRIDILRAPLHHDKYGLDIVEWCKMYALGCVHSRYDTFNAFYNDRELLHRTVDGVLAEYDLSVVHSEPSAGPVPGNPAAALSHAILTDDLTETLRLIDSGLGVERELPDWRDEFTSEFWGSRLGIGEIVDEVHVAHDHADGLGTHKPLTLAGRRGNRGIVEALIARGADVDARDVFGRTVLFSAAEHGWDTLVDELLARGADAGATSLRGDHPIQRAVTKGHLPIVKRLVEAGAALRPPDVLLRQAAGSNRAHVLEYLLRGEIPMEVRQETAAAAVFYNSAESLEVLLRHGIDPEHRDEDGLTLLMLAAKQGFPGIVSRLLAAGADRDATDPDGRTALELRGGRRPYQVYELLTEDTGPR